MTINKDNVTRIENWNLRNTMETNSLGIAYAWQHEEITDGPPEKNGEPLKVEIYEVKKKFSEKRKLPR
jgi:hypothetical protein